MTIHRKSTRLPAKEYLGRKIYFVTICCDNRAPHLRHAETAAAVQGNLLSCTANKPFRIHAYCLMPDHAHVLAEGMEPQSNLLEFVRLFKQRSAYEFRKKTGQQLWESGFYDCILRPSDSLEDVSAYIWWNPVRRHLCSQPKDFSFSGSQTIDWIARSRLVSTWSAPWKLAEQKRKERV